MKLAFVLKNGLIRVYEFGLGNGFDISKKSVPELRKDGYRVFYK